MKTSYSIGEFLSKRAWDHFQRQPKELFDRDSTAHWRLRPASLILRRPHWRRVGALGLEGGTEKPMPLQTLHQLVGVYNSLGHRTEQVRVHLDLLIEIAGQSGKVIERSFQVLRQFHTVRIRAAQPRVR